MFVSVFKRMSSLFENDLRHLFFLVMKCIDGMLANQWKLLFFWQIIMEIILDSFSWSVLINVLLLAPQRGRISDARVDPEYPSYYRGYFFWVYLRVGKVLRNYLNDFCYELPGSEGAGQCGIWAHHPSARHSIEGWEDQTMEPERATGRFKSLLVTDNVGMVP